MRREWSALVLVCVQLVTTESHAGDSAPRLARVEAAAERGELVGVTAAAGGGFASDELAPEHRHYRLDGSLLAAWQPWSTIGFELELAGRYDRQTGLPAGSGIDDGWIGAPRLGAHIVRRVRPRLALGVAASAWLPGRDAPSIAPGAASAALKALATWSPFPADVALHANLGFRVDRSAALVRDRMALSDADRVALGASDFDAALIGIGATWRVRPDTAVLVEWSWDALVGRGAPPPTASPMRIGAGISHAIADTISVEALATFGVADRRAMIARPELVPVEPSFALTLGVTTRVPRRAAARAPARLDDGPGRLLGTVLDPDRRPIVGARVRVRSGGDAREVTTDAAGRYALDIAAPGEADVEIWAEGYHRTRLHAAISSGRAQTLHFELERAVIPGQIRGVVRDRSGGPVAATIRVDDAEVATGADGTFTMDVSPGTHELRAAAAGHEGATRSVTVEENGVVIIDVELDAP